MQDWNLFHAYKQNIQIMCENPDKSAANLKYQGSSHFKGTAGAGEKLHFCFSEISKFYISQLLENTMMQKGKCTDKQSSAWSCTTVNNAHFVCMYEYVLLAIGRPSFVMDLQLNAKMLFSTVQFTIFCHFFSAPWRSLPKEIRS